MYPSFADLMPATYRRISTRHSKTTNTLPPDITGNVITGNVVAANLTMSDFQQQMKSDIT
ncbi:MAG: hypothetical protein CMM01_22715 [Rhodopirellula sp.]|nr:hypothetical protein [Rhodopirellula sp.]